MRGWVWSGNVNCFKANNSLGRGFSKGNLSADTVRFYAHQLRWRKLKKWLAFPSVIYSGRPPISCYSQVQQSCKTALPCPFVPTHIHTHHFIRCKVDEAWQNQEVTERQTKYKVGAHVRNLINPVWLFSVKTRSTKYNKYVCRFRAFHQLLDTFYILFMVPRMLPSKTLSAASVDLFQLLAVWKQWEVGR